ncbi:MAG: translation initiation factor IF-5A [Desulfurococcales archaeon]|nr:translation initiation factor IF-5A [Desulfurococcales archaeon]MCE4622593.1 translation initiation factor IF-5A [Desulfurococcales archaeon]MCE4627089.1 translation initiation factor IF-5A [Desulfurococcales archaeon]MCE4629657.1 translation initiation factor IF-5A [Desulfurococcales archaeon]
MSVNYASLGELKKGSYIVIDGEPCRIVEITRAKTGKHGSAKAHVVAISVFTGQKKTLVAPVDTRVQVPVIEKRLGQIIADMGDMIQVMDMETFDTFEVEKPEEENLASKLEPGVTVEYWLIMGRPKIIRIRDRQA